MSGLETGHVAPPVRQMSDPGVRWVEHPFWWTASLPNICSTVNTSSARDAGPAACQLPCHRSVGRMRPQPSGACGSVRPMLGPSGALIGSRSKGSATPLLSSRARRMAFEPKRRRIASAACVARRRRSSAASNSESCSPSLEVGGCHPEQPDLDAAHLRPGQLEGGPEQHLGLVGRLAQRALPRRRSRTRSHAPSRRPSAHVTPAAPQATRRPPRRAPGASAPAPPDRRCRRRRCARG